MQDNQIVSKLNWPVVQWWLVAGGLSLVPLFNQHFLARSQISESVLTSCTNCAVLFIKSCLLVTQGEDLINKNRNTTKHCIGLYPYTLQSTRGQRTVPSYWFRLYKHSLRLILNRIMNAGGIINVKSGNNGQLIKLWDLFDQLSLPLDYLDNFLKIFLAFCIVKGNWKFWISLFKISIKSCVMLFYFKIIGTFSVVNWLLYQNFVYIFLLVFLCTIFVVCYCLNI